MRIQKPLQPTLGTLGGVEQKASTPEASQPEVSTASSSLVAPAGAQDSFADAPATGRGLVIPRPPIVPIPPIVVPVFTPPACDLKIPDNLGRPVTSLDVTVTKVFDGRTPQEALAMVRQHLRTPLHDSNVSFVDKTVIDHHKGFTIAVNNAFIAGSPSQKFAQQNPDAKFSIVGTMSAVHPTLVCLERPGQEPAYFKRGPAGYEKLTPMRYPIIMKADIRSTPQGVRVSYPDWSAKVLSGPTCEIVEM
ncbi:MAG: hypothetical protein HY901_18945 [Deltaproteobacteria bacterium]|nr:hypothetical protein [Deltaproteobacteria bacterium]